MRAVQSMSPAAKLSPDHHQTPHCFPFRLSQKPPKHDSWKDKHITLHLPVSKPTLSAHLPPSSSPQSSRERQISSQQNEGTTEEEKKWDHNLTFLLSGCRGETLPPRVECRHFASVARKPVSSALRLQQACPWACGLEVCAVGRGCHVSHCSRASEAGFLPQQTLPTTTAVDQPPPLLLSSSSSSSLQLLPLSLRRCETLTPQLPYRATKKAERGVFQRRPSHRADKEMLQREDIRQPG